MAERHCIFMDVAGYGKWQGKCREIAAYMEEFEERKIQVSRQKRACVGDRSTEREGKRGKEASKEKREGRKETAEGERREREKDDTMSSMV